VPAAYRTASVLRYAAIQFIALTACAMVAYGGGSWLDPAADHYEFTGNFLSDLGMTHAFSGRANYTSCALFAIALSTIGIALVAFAWTWRDFTFARRRAAGLGWTSAVLGTASGLAFTGVAVTPFDLAMDLHNIFVIAAFTLLLGYVAAITLVMWRNGIGGMRLAINAAYLALVVGYVTLVLVGPRIGTPGGHRIQVTGQKAIAYGSMLHVLYLATTTRRALASQVARLRVAG
jgi:hypothetical protein